MTPLTESELAEVAVAITRWATFLRDEPERMRRVRALYAKIAALNEGADK